MTEKKIALALCLWTITIVGVMTTVYLQGKIDATESAIKQIAKAADCVKENGEWKCRKHIQ